VEDIFNLLNAVLGLATLVKRVAEEERTGTELQLNRSALGILSCIPIEPFPQKWVVDLPGFFLSSASGSSKQEFQR